MIARRPPDGRHSIRTELLLSLAILAVAALAFAVAAVELMAGQASTARGAVYLVVLVAADVLVFVVFAAAQVERAVIRPLRATVDAAEAIAGGALERRVPPGASVEFANLSASVNRMTDHLLEERAHLVRAEKLASVGRLAAGVAHEIGNPLGAINGYTHLLRRGAADDRARAALDGLQREADRIDRIVRGLLDYGREHPRADTRVDVNDTVRAVHELLATQGVLRRVGVSMELAAPALPVRADRHDLEQVFVNLFLNAVDAMDGGGEIVVRTGALPRARAADGGARRAGDSPDTRVPRAPSGRVSRWLAGTEARDVVKIVVADSGPGVAADMAERIFDPFVTTKDPGRGTGLGLAIVARIVENFGGTVWVEPSRAGGAAFHLLLPLDPA